MFNINLACWTPSHDRRQKQNALFNELPIICNYSASNHRVKTLFSFSGVCSGISCVGDPDKTIKEVIWLPLLEYFYEQSFSF